VILKDGFFFHRRPGFFGEDLLFKDDLEGNVETFFCVFDGLNLFDVFESV
jgi:hypothetical protein